MTPPARGFPIGEFKGRTQRAQDMMRAAGLSALLLTTEPEVRYYTGFLTRFWESPTRPWFVVVPSEGDPIAVIPAIGVHLMSQTWIKDIRTWDAPNYTDDGIGQLAGTLCNVTDEHARIGLAHAMESHARLPLGSLEGVRRQIGKRQITSDHEITRRLRMIKSDTEIAKIRYAADIANRAFERVPDIARTGEALSAIFRHFQMLCLDEGADWVPYLAGAASQGGYADVISPATDAPVAAGDVLMLDTGVVWDGYFCDFDRNFSIGMPSQHVEAAHEKLITATEAALAVAHPGRRISELYHAMDAHLKLGRNAGRLGHGLGMQLTEWPSVLPDDQTVLRPGMVLTIEPYVAMGDGKIMVHEENIVICETSAEYLSRPATPKIPSL
ncbi:MAG: M24 family metallopeptidase [Roseobacter sp.]